MFQVKTPVTGSMLALLGASGGPGCVKLPPSASLGSARRNRSVSPSGSVAGTRKLHTLFCRHVTMGGSAVVAEALFTPTETTASTL